jgi:hypothetical protein
MRRLLPRVVASGCWLRLPTTTRTREEEDEEEDEEETVTTTTTRTAAAAEKKTLGSEQKSPRKANLWRSGTAYDTYATHLRVRPRDERAPSWVKNCRRRRRLRSPPRHDDCVCVGQKKRRQGAQSLDTNTSFLSLLLRSQPESVFRVTIVHGGEDAILGSGCE